MIIMAKAVERRDGERKGNRISLTEYKLSQSNSLLVQRFMGKKSTIGKHVNVKKKTFFAVVYYFLIRILKKQYWFVSFLRTAVTDRSDNVNPVH